MNDLAVYQPVSPGPICTNWEYFNFGATFFTTSYAGLVSTASFCSGPRQFVQHLRGNPQLWGSNISWLISKTFLAGSMALTASTYSLHQYFCGHLEPGVQQQMHQISKEILELRQLLSSNSKPYKLVTQNFHAMYFNLATKAQDATLMQAAKQFLQPLLPHESRLSEDRHSLSLEEAKAYLNHALEQKSAQDSVISKWKKIFNYMDPA